MPVLTPGHTIASVSDKISAIVLTRRTPRGWFIGFGLAFLLTMVLMAAVAYLFAVGIGIWGVNIPVGWGFAIGNSSRGLKEAMVQLFPSSGAP
jgi:molybdopterin-containing oxidoreductase family membrane subunit